MLLTPQNWLNRKDVTYGRKYLRAKFRICLFVCLILEDRETSLHGRYRSKEKHHLSYSLQQWIRRLTFTRFDCKFLAKCSENNCTITSQLFLLKSLKEAMSRFVHLEKFSLFKFLICNPCQSSPSLTILVPFCFILPILGFFYLTKLIFYGFSHVEGYFACRRKRLEISWRSFLFLIAKWYNYKVNV